MYDRCRHIRVGGDRCRAMALKDKAFCYFHLHHRRKPVKTKIAVTGSAPAVIDFELPLLEDRYAIQIGITQIARALAANEIDPRRAGLLLYSLQIASSNLRDDSSLIPEDVRRVVLTATNDEIAPAKTIFEAQDLNNHKKGCACDDCVFTQEDNEPHHPGCECGDAWFHQPQPAAAADAPAITNPPETLTIQAVAVAGTEKSSHPERSETEEPAVSSASARKWVPHVSQRHGIVFYKGYTQNQKQHEPLRPHTGPGHSIQTRAAGRAHASAHTRRIRRTGASAWSRQAAPRADRARRRLIDDLLGTAGSR